MCCKKCRGKKLCHCVFCVWWKVWTAWRPAYSRLVSKKSYTLLEHFIQGLHQIWSMGAIAPTIFLWVGVWISLQDGQPAKLHLSFKIPNEAPVLLWWPRFSLKHAHFLESLLKDRWLDLVRAYVKPTWLMFGIGYCSQNSHGHESKHGGRTLRTAHGDWGSVWRQGKRFFLTCLWSTFHDYSEGPQFSMGWILITDADSYVIMALSIWSKYLHIILILLRYFLDTVLIVSDT